MRLAHRTVICLLVAPLAAQGFALRDATRVTRGMAAYDNARHRVVEIGWHGETREFDGATFLQRPVLAPRLLGTMVHRSAAGRTFAHGARLDDTSLTFVVESWEYDGSEWHDVSTGTTPATYAGVAMAYDSQRDRVVMFGGSTLAGVGPGNTYEWDGSNWSIVATGGPTARAGARMAYDAIRGVSVLFGGQVASVGLQDEHWEWDGTTWTQRTFTAAPSARNNAAMAFDASRGVTVLYGGTGLTSTAQLELWEFDGISWTHVNYTAGTGPGDRSDAAMVYDERTQRVLVIGFDFQTRRHDYHAWDGNSWQFVAATEPIPAQTRYASSCYEPPSGGILQHGSLFSGVTAHFTNGAWAAVSQASPGARQEPTLWHDGSDAYLFGGQTYFGNQLLNDVYRWTGAGWQQLTPATAPPPRRGASIAYDSARNEAVLFGGSSSGLSPDTWTFDGTSWTQRTPTTLPPGRSHAGMAYDPVRDRVVMFGGSGSPAGPRNDTWEWDGSNWTPVLTPQAPPKFDAAALAYDAANNRIVMTGAHEPDTLISTLVEAWTYDGTNWMPLPLTGPPRIAGARHDLIARPTGELLLVDSMAVMELVDRMPIVEALGTGCGAPPPILTARELPTVGNAAFGFDLLSAPPSTPVVFAGSDTAATTTLFGCTLQLATLQATITEISNPSGVAARDIPIPNQPALLGTSWTFQCLAPQAASASGFALSGGVRITIGMP